jgi:hypothetical protein
MFLSHHHSIVYPILMILLNKFILIKNREKLQQWLEKKGRSGCRHLGCLGPQQRKEYEALSNAADNSARKSIKVTKPLNANHHHQHEESGNAASPQLKVILFLLIV